MATDWVIMTSSTATDALMKCSADNKQALRAAIDGLVNNQTPDGARKISGTENQYHYRPDGCKGYRIVYNLNWTEKVIGVLAIHTGTLQDVRAAFSKVSKM